MELVPVDIQFAAARPWKTLRNLYRPERRDVVLAISIHVLKASPVWVLPIVTANIVDVLAHPGADSASRLMLNASVGAAAIVQNIPTTALYVGFLSRAIRNVEVRLRSALVRRLQMLSLGFLGRNDTAVLQTKLVRDVESIEQLSRQLVGVGFFAAASILVALSVTAVRAPSFVLVFAAFIPLVLVCRRMLAGPLQRRKAGLRREIEGMNSFVLSMLNMLPVTRAHAVEADEIDRVEGRFSQVRTAARAFDRTAGVLGAVAWVSLMLVNLGGLVGAAWLTHRGILALSPGDFVLVAGYFGAIMTVVMQLNALLPVVTRGFDALQSIGEVLECPDIEENRGKRPVPSVRGEFVFDCVGFAYDRSAGAPPALADVSFRVEAGETVGIVGPSGSGKSSLVNLVTGFHRPTSGRLLLDGIDITEVDLRTFRRQLAVVGQQTILFSGSLRENIVYGARNVSDAALAAALASANVSDFLEQLPAGLDTMLGTGGVQLIGGQRQRIAIARALLRDPRVLILDEATSALDANSEEVVRKALLRLSAGRTTFIVSHRPALLQRIDQLVVMERGRVVHAGIFTHHRRYPDGDVLLSDQAGRTAHARSQPAHRQPA